MICNADEGDPAFHGPRPPRIDPHQVIEDDHLRLQCGGDARLSLYSRRVSHGCAAGRDSCGRRGKGARNDILGSGYAFDLEVFQGSGAFVCGEATALVESMEGRMGIPQTRPPRLATAGLRGCPTVLNNVKTFSYVPQIIRKGAAWFKETGTAGSPGTAVFSLVGKVAHTIGEVSRAPPAPAGL